MLKILINLAKKSVCVGLVNLGPILLLLPLVTFPENSRAAEGASDPHTVLTEVGKIVSDHGLDQAAAVEIGGIRQWITVRGRDRRNPLLLVLHGGPAAPDIPNRFLFEGPWTDFFTVVEWDQRGAGKTYELNDPARIAPTMHAARMVQDTEELVAYLRKTYNVPKIFVLGHSWGTILGLQLAERHPDWLYAYIGVGQIINMREGESIDYQFDLDQAHNKSDAVALKELQAIEPYPERDGSLPIKKLSVVRKWSVRFGGLTHGRQSYDFWADAQEISPDYDATDIKALDAGSAFSVPKLLPEIATTDFTSINQLKCPIIIFSGRYDYTTPSEPVLRWFERLSAPVKSFSWFENSAHMLYAEEPGRVLMHLVDDALPLAASQGKATLKGH